MVVWISAGYHVRNSRRVVSKPVFFSAYNYIIMLNFYIYQIGTQGISTFFQKNQNIFKNFRNFCKIAKSKSTGTSKIEKNVRSKKVQHNYIRNQKINTGALAGNLLGGHGVRLTLVQIRYHTRFPRELMSVYFFYFHTFKKNVSHSYSQGKLARTLQII